MTMRCHRLIAAPCIAQAHAALPVHVSIAGCQGDGAIGFCICCTPVPVVEEPQQAECGMPLGKIFIERHGVNRCCLGLTECLLWLHAEEISELDEAFRNGGIRGGMARI